MRHSHCGVRREVCGFPEVAERHHGASFAVFSRLLFYGNRLMRKALELTELRDVMISVIIGAASALALLALLYSRNN